MKKILLISKEWSPKQNTGLGLCSAEHEKILKSLNYDVITVSSNDLSKDFSVGFKNFINFIFKAYFYFNECKKIINSVKPDLIVVESLQTVISEIFLYLAYKNSVKSVIISHGVSIFPHKIKFIYILRFVLWLFYIPLFYYLLKISNYLFSLDAKSKNVRHLDTNLCKIIKNDKVFLYNNTSRFEDFKKIIKTKDTQKYILCLGYINHIKNQFELIEIAKKTKELDVTYKIVYNYFDKRYFDTFKVKLKKAGLRNIVILHEKDVNIFEEISNCWLLINVSITEVMPLSLIEGNCLSKTFLSYNVGSVDKLTGIINQNTQQMIFNLKSLYHNKFFKEKLENQSLKIYKAYYSNNKLLESFLKFNEIIKY
jgi:glycosyltransferase involved in cell wall biosynthesis